MYENRKRLDGFQRVAEAHYDLECSNEVENQFRRAASQMYNPLFMPQRHVKYVLGRPVVALKRINR